MPIHDSDWSLQFFADVACPEDVDIPASDPEAWAWNPRHRWVYNKLDVVVSQGLACGPYGVRPEHYPVFSKPIMNLHGMGADSAILSSLADYERLCRPGHMWMELLDGAHVSTDVAVERGQVRWWRHASGIPAGQGMFDYWTIFADAKPEIENYVGAWIADHLADYTGMLNFETIGARIIELHLRFSDQWPDIYGGRPWVDALVGLYAAQRWSFEDRGRRDGYSVALFGPADGHYRHPPQALQDDILGRPGISSLQITFHEDQTNDWHSNPPGGFRLAVINGWDIEAGKRARRDLARSFGLARIINETGT
ncbi:MAG: hypothetical protein R3D57_10250 [Hyphomicrobiaceae bacterium]